MMDMESFSTITSVKPNSIPMSTALRQAKASASKAEPTITCRRDLETKTSPFTFRTTIPEAYLKPWQSNGASKLILRSCPKVFSNSHSHQQRFLFLFNQNDHKPQPEKGLWRFVYLPNTQALRTENTLEGSPRHITMSICSSITSGIYRILSASSVSKVASEDFATTAALKIDTEDKLKLGGSELKVTKLGIGAWSWGDTSYWNNFQWDDQKLKAAKAAFNKSLDCGITFFDTAEVYGSPLA